jgi:hypothetical protein
MLLYVKEKITKNMAETKTYSGQTGTLHQRLAGEFREKGFQPEDTGVNAIIII